MGTVTDDQRCEVLRDTLDLWRIDGCVETLAPPGLALVRMGPDVVVRIAYAEPGSGFRWIVYTEGALSPSPPHGRPCGSWVGVLGALRRAFAIDRGSPIRIAAETE